MGRPAKHNKRDVVNAVLHVAATGCQWRSLPDSYPNWSTVHNYHLEWSRNGTWERVADRLRVLVRVQAGHDPHPSASIIDARTVRGASTVTSATRGYDAGKKISGRKTFGLVDTLGLLFAVVVMSASTSDNTGGIEAFNAGKRKSRRLTKVWCDSGFKKTFQQHCRDRNVDAEVVTKIHPGEFVVEPQRWIIERTWAWLMSNRRLQIDYERDPDAHVGFVWAAHSRLLLRRLKNHSQ